MSIITGTVVHTDSQGKAGVEREGGAGRQEALAKLLLTLEMPVP